ncbi:nitrogenase subunit NifH [Methanolinea mesophila]|uniref:hypothetical protein n=1 Tax=Methanolinea mesophila TaxID=547055 RepID=UPI001AE36C03|nr:hypothetical protein [Methanolinea mesophila]MBP1928294.1 nitrogenase subunit NifH [Methanolinea mesophila]
MTREIASNGKDGCRKSPVRQYTAEAMKHSLRKKLLVRCCDSNAGCTRRIPDSGTHSSKIHPVCFRAD